MTDDDRRAVVVRASEAGHFEELEWRWGHAAAWSTAESAAVWAIADAVEALVGPVRKKAELAFLVVCALAGEADEGNMSQPWAERAYQQVKAGRTSPTEAVSPDGDRGE